MSSPRPENDNSSATLVQAHTNRLSSVFNTTLHQHLHKISQNLSLADNAILTDDMNATLGRLPSDETHLLNPFDLDYCRSDNRERLLTLCSNRYLHLVSKKFEILCHRQANWFTFSLSQQCTEINNQDRVQDCQSRWRNYFGYV